MAAPISAIDLFNILRAKIGEQEAKALTDYVAAEVTSRVDAQKDVLATKADIQATKDDIHKLSDRLSEKISDQFKWIVGLFIPLYLSIIGLIITLLLRH